MDGGAKAMITAEEVKTAMLATGKRFFPVRSCSLCGVDIGYILGEDGSVAFQTSCGCVSYYHSHPSSFQDVADFLNRNLHRSSYERLCRGFGVLA
jgi:hypothetical protein